MSTKIQMSTKPEVGEKTPPPRAMCALTLDAVRWEKEKLEAEVVKLLRRFEERTGLLVERLDVEDVVTRGRETQRVRAVVEL